MRRYLMHEHHAVVKDRSPEPEDITSSEHINGRRIIYHMPWSVSFDDLCDFSWWVPKYVRREEVRKTTMLEF
jgi:hypothetical protein